ncbi:hypothetical protein D4764_05G0000950 [Takifugu flavidus]|uniref:Uncharacterized protein n=1 Tax=Takifugu flavidus TaxID=433684 RepID=A0A5C6MYR4_9TELE|nr:hypothetical protein D4764_05G0000950 [Takifugu flavidus]
MIGKEERGSDGSYPSSRSSSSSRSSLPSVEGPERLQGQGSEPGSLLFVIVVWNFELYMIPLALLLPLAWNYILIVSGKDTRQDVSEGQHPESCVFLHRWRINKHGSGYMCGSPPRVTDYSAVTRCSANRSQISGSRKSPNLDRPEIKAGSARGQEEEKASMQERGVCRAPGAQHIPIARLPLAQKGPGQML